MSAAAAAVACQGTNDIALCKRISVHASFTPFCMLQVSKHAERKPAGRPLLGILLAICAGGVNVVWMSSLWLAFYGSLMPWQPESAIWCQRVYGTRCFPAKEAKGAVFFTTGLGY
ncbi:MAG: hypothetical protein ACLTDX_19180 [[Clostridium] innocuum]